MSSALIEFRNVSKVYSTGRIELCALNAITLSFAQGEFWAIMGPSGSGKSTMLNLLGCLDRPTAGECLLRGTDTATLDDDSLSQIRLNEIGFIFQSFNLIPQLSVLENIEMPLYYLGQESSLSVKRASELADSVGLGDRLHHKPTELSGGERQRAAVARALANDPAVILADEPTGNLDTRTGDQIMALLDGLHREGRTILMVTHEHDVAAHAQKTLHLRDGEIERIETRAAGDARRA